MRAYSKDLRERLVVAVEQRELSLRQIAHLFAVDLSSLVRLLQRHRRTGTVDPKPHAGGRSLKLDDQAQAHLLDLVREQPDATQTELQDRLGIACCLVTIARALQRHHITRKKKSLHAKEQDAPRVQAQRKTFRKKLASVDPDHLVFVDETGATTGMTRTYGRAPRGKRVKASAPATWQNVTLIVGMRTSGVVAPMAVVGATDGAVFQTYVAEMLVPELRPGDVVVWDNLQPHKNAEVVAAIQGAGARVEPLPVCSPDLTPIEEMFSKTKEHLRTVAPRTTETVITAMGEALDQVTHFDILGWFHDRCLYAMR